MSLGNSVQGLPFFPHGGAQILKLPQYQYSHGDIAGVRRFVLDITLALGHAHDDEPHLCSQHRALRVIQELRRCQYAR
jgi:hypothetical protein